MKPQTTTSTLKSSATSVLTPSATVGSPAASSNVNTQGSDLLYKESAAASTAASEEEKQKAAMKDAYINAAQINEQVLNRSDQSASDYADAKVALAQQDIENQRALYEKQQAEAERQKQVAIDEMQPLEQQKIAQLNAEKENADASAQLAIQAAQETAEASQIQNSVNWGSAA